jgi:hypothetical protein
MIVYETLHTHFCKFCGQLKHYAKINWVYIHFFYYPV